jgi:hypothetical protein
MSSQERKSTRLESVQFISYRLFDSEERVCEEGMARTTDISRSGVAVENRTSFEVGAKIELTIALKEDVVRADGLVRNVVQVDESTFQIGIEFTTMTEEKVNQIAQEFPEILN